MILTGGDRIDCLRMQGRTRHVLLREKRVCVSDTGMRDEARSFRAALRRLAVCLSVVQTGDVSETENGEMQRTISAGSHLHLRDFLKERQEGLVNCHKRALIQAAISAPTRSNQSREKSQRWHAAALQSHMAAMEDAVMQGEPVLHTNLAEIASPLAGRHWAGKRASRYCCNSAHTCVNPILSQAFRGFGSWNPQARRRSTHLIRSCCTYDDRLDTGHGRRKRGTGIIDVIREGACFSGLHLFATTASVAPD